MKGVISLTDNGSKNYKYALICARRMIEAEDVDDIVLLTRAEGVELFDAELDPAIREELTTVIDGDVTCKASYPCVDARDMELLDGVECVENEIVELLTLQSEGYDLIKVP